MNIRKIKTTLKTLNKQKTLLKHNQETNRNKQQRITDTQEQKIRTPRQSINYDTSGKSETKQKTRKTLTK